MQPVTPIPYTARCPQCGTDAEYTTRLAYPGCGYHVVPRIHITCPVCGPCPCCEEVA